VKSAANVTQVLTMMAYVMGAGFYLVAMMSKLFINFMCEKKI
jgi:hypothetical protein